METFTAFGIAGATLGPNREILFRDAPALQDMEHAAVGFVTCSGCARRQQLRVLRSGAYVLPFTRGGWRLEWDVVGESVKATCSECRPVRFKNVRIPHYPLAKIVLAYRRTGYETAVVAAFTTSYPEIEHIRASYGREGIVRFWQNVRKELREKIERGEGREVFAYEPLDFDFPFWKSEERDAEIARLCS